MKSLKSLTLPPPPPPPPAQKKVKWSVPTLIGFPCVYDNDNGGTKRTKQFYF